MSMLITLLLTIYGVLVVALIAFVAVTYNQLVRLKNKVKNSYAQSETQMQRIDDLEETEERTDNKRQGSGNNSKYYVHLLSTSFYINFYHICE